MISKEEKQLLHIYAAAAHLTRGIYQSILRDETGCTSSTDPEFSHDHCTRVLARFEAIAYRRFADSEIPDPSTYSRHVKPSGHFAARLRPPGLATQNQLHMIRRLWSDLSTTLHADDSYLDGMILKSLGYAVTPDRLSRRQASAVLDALKARLAAEIRAQNSNFT